MKKQIVKVTVIRMSESNGANDPRSYSYNLYIPITNYGRLLRTVTSMNDRIGVDEDGTVLAAKKKAKIDVKLINLFDDKIKNWWGSRCIGNIAKRYKLYVTTNTMNQWDIDDTTCIGDFNNEFDGQFEEDIEN